MYYLYLGRGHSFSDPKYLIVCSHNRYFKRDIHTDFSEMEQEEIDALLQGRDDNYYAIEKEDFQAILSSWGGSSHSYEILSQEVIYDEEALNYLSLDDED